MTNEEPAELTEPGVGAFDNPASFVASELPSVFVSPALAVLAVRHDEVDASLFEPFAERVGVVGAVRDHAFRLLSRTALGTRDFDLGERGFRKRNFSRRGTFEPNSQPKTATSTSTIHFVPLPRLVLPTAEPPFSPARSCRPGTPLLTAAGLRRPAHPAGARHASSHTPCSSHCFKRRQQVAGDLSRSDRLRPARR
jgi:hypothetical protein